MVQRIKGICQKTPFNLQMAILFVYDVFAICTAELLALLTRFDFSLSNVDTKFLEAIKGYSLINILTCLLFFSFFKLYSSLWQYAGVQELFNIVLACIFGGACQLIGMHMLYLNVPRSYFVLFGLYFLILTGVSRMAFRGMRALIRNIRPRQQNKRLTMVIGAGDAGFFLAKEILNSDKIENGVVCFIDDDKSKIGQKLLGIPIVGNRAHIEKAVHKYGIEEIFVAIPSLKGAARNEIYTICKSTGCRVQTLPSVGQMINGDTKISMLRDVELEDLLGRDPVTTNLEEVMGYICGRTVLVTGGGGSIGSELCRQIAKHEPKKLILLDIYENTTYDIQLELRRKYPALQLIALIGSVRNTHRIEQIFKDYRPDIVFHAAAHKHVPLMEDSPNEAIKNNVFGTLNVARAAAEYEAKRMVLISTDKAVNPTNIMGASKRICEMIVQGMDRLCPKTSYVAVRFGNVLGSNGSVVPLFKKQIAAGGPVTVTDKNIIRYFMTIPEAVSLVLQAGAYARGGEIFVLDMGKPVRIDDMARNLIKLSGYEPDVDIKIVYTGLRPGEKLFEECLREEEGLQKTENDLIFIGKPIVFNESRFFDQLVDLKRKAYQDSEEMKEMVSRLIPSYRYQKPAIEEAAGRKKVEAVTSNLDEEYMVEVKAEVFQKKYRPHNA